MEKTIVFIHGMFVNSKSWLNWVHFYEQQGFKCIAPSWPLHEGEPAELRRNIPEGLGTLHLKSIIDKYTDIISTLPEKPIVIGHSVGGLIAQLFASNGIAEMGIAISPVAPNKMLSLDFNLFKNAMTISNPLKRDEPYLISPEGFHESFCNTMSQEDALTAYHEFAVHDSRNVFRDCMKEPGKIDMETPHVPLLFVSADEDKIIPASLTRKNFEAYKDKASRRDYKEFYSRGHFICGQPGWQEVAKFCLGWIEKIRTEELLEIGHS